MSDRITLTGLSATGFHGVLESERRDGQTFVADVTIELDTSVAGRTDNLADSVDYSVIASQVVSRIQGEPVNLIETLAEKIASDILATYLVTAVEVTVHKPQAPITETFADVSVHIRRERS